MIISRALAYYLFSGHRTGRGLSDPSSRRLVRGVLADERPYPAYTVMEHARRDYLTDDSVVTFRDPGAGHHQQKKAVTTRRIRDIARYSSGHPKYHRLLYRLARHYGPSVILETGTALGLGTLALALGNPAATVFTIEGAPPLAARARNLFETQKQKNITLLEGLFDERLPGVLSRDRPVDMAFLDGHHKEEATLRYFGMLLPRLHPQSIVLIDDIYWSKGMARAWKKIRRHEKVTLSIDIFRMGILFFDPELPSQTFTIRF